ncbi:MAG: pyruvate flavodoxin/ferredoxin oxidoreductase [Deltaproteobacteria bacterium]|nr:MAG: pyruvate flavodoxin/ferredoxin oxidoreductase [Deltaproteobacteria bacterium]
MTVSFIEGNEAVARAAVIAGCNFFAGYPITPATTIFNTMLKLLPPAGGICMQGEDEIASIGFCLGASMAGMKAMTATSGPGISLYSEQISFAIGSEIPIVIADVQRLGPSTGSATLGADGDIQFLRWGNSGGLPVIVLSPTDITDCFILTIQAFNLAEKFRCPVFIASNKDIGMTRESIDIRNLTIPEIESRKTASPANGFQPFAVHSDTGVPDFLPIGSSIPVRQTSSTHGTDGYITNDPKAIQINRTRLAGKLKEIPSNYFFFEARTEQDATTLLITYGVTARSARQAHREEKHSGKPFSLLILKTLWPVPQDLIQEHARGMKTVIVVEMNLGQYVREIERILPNIPVQFLGQMNGCLITPTQIKEFLNHG